MHHYLHRMNNLLWQVLIVCILPTYAWGQLALHESIDAVKDQTQLRTLKSVLLELESQHQVSIVFQDQDVENKMVNKSNLTGEKLEEGLRRLLSSLGLTYEKVKPDVYVITEENKKQEVKKVERKKVGHQDRTQENIGKLLSRAPVPIGVSVLDITITGTVTDLENNEVLPGVNVVVKGTTLGTVTDVEGRYRLTVPDDAVTLLFSSVGYTSEEEAINNRSVIDMVLSPDITSLSEVVVIGYGSVKKSDLTGSVSSLNEKDFNPGANASLDQMIQGRAPGVSVVQSSSEPGGGVSIRVRGSSSINAGNSPLYVVDGLPLDNGNVTPGSGIVPNRTPRNPLNTLNPGDIESIEVLKDASATAIYGSRGANGVVLITTKKGSKGKFSLSYDVYGGIQQVARTYDVLDARQYTTVLNQLREAAGEEPEFSQEEINAIGEGTDWQDEIIRSASVQNHQLSLSGGGDNNQYYVSFNYFNQQGVVINSGLKRYTGRVNLTQSLNDRFSFGLNLTTSLVADQFTPFGVEQNERAGVIQAATFYDPTAPIVGPDGKYFQSTVINLENPVALAREVYNNAETNRTFGNAYLEYEILNNLKAKVNAGSDRQTARRDSYNPTSTFTGFGSGGAADVSTRDASNYLVETTLNYNNRFGKDHTFNLLGGYTYQVFTTTGLSSSAIGFPSDAFLTNNLGAGNQENFQLGSFRAKNQLQSYLGRVNYNFKERYLLTASIRADGSSRFGAGNKFGYFPSVAASWRLINEPFIEPIDFLTDLKLRMSYGVTGNQEIGNYNSLTLLAANELAFLGGTSVVGISPSQVPNPNLRWERTSQYNIGIDVGMADNRITASADYFIKNTSDLLLNLPIPSTTGFENSLQNVGAVRNSGYELMINTENLVGPFKWSSSLNFTAINNEVTDLAGLPFILQGGFGFLPDFTILREGEAANAYYGYEVAGVYQSGEDIAGSPQPMANPGDLKFKDQDGDNAITPEDRIILGSPFPDFTFGINNRFSYKGFEIDFFFQGSYGNELFNRNVLESDNPTSFRRNRFAQPYLNRWTPENPTNEHPSFLPISTVYGGNNNSRYVEDASYIRLRNLQIRYNFDVTNVGFLKTVSLYLTGQNLFTITNYSGYDPDVSSYGNSNVRIDYNAYPLARIYMLGLNVGF